jgi:hypothetical protein
MFKINKNKKEKEIQSIEKNKMRIFCRNLNPFLKKIFGLYYYIIHVILIFLGCIILLFSSNIIYLLIILNIIFLDGIAILAFHECPLTILEQKYLNTNMSKQSKYNFNNLDINHRCKHIYESQFELIVNLFTLISVKILFIIMMKSIHISFN